MSMYKLNEKTKNNIFKKTGMTVDEIINSDVDVIDSNISRKTKCKLSYSTIKNNLLIGRGQPYIYLNRLLKMQTIDKALKRIK